MAFVGKTGGTLEVFFVLVLLLLNLLYCLFFGA
jgi:hypothetical protein